MMQNASISQQIEVLTPEAQKLVIKLILLLSRQTQQPIRQKTKRLPLNKERFIGMWKDRAAL